MFCSVYVMWSAKRFVMGVFQVRDMTMNIENWSYENIQWKSISRYSLIWDIKATSVAIFHLSLQIYTSIPIKWDSAAPWKGQCYVEFLRLIFIQFQTLPHSPGHRVFQTSIQSDKAKHCNCIACYSYISLHSVHFKVSLLIQSIKW